MTLKRKHFEIISKRTPDEREFNFPYCEANNTGHSI